MPGWEATWVNRGQMLGSELDALGVGSRTNVGTEYPNQTNLSEVGKFELFCSSFVTAPATGGQILIFSVTAPGGTNYGDGSNTVDPGNHTLRISIPVRPSATSQRLMSQPFGLEPAKTKFLLSNATSVSFLGSGSTLTLYTANK